MKRSKNVYTVCVGNVGNMEYTNKKLAIDCYKTYVTLSTNNQTRAAGENVTILLNGEPMPEYDFIGSIAMIEFQN